MRKNHGYHKSGNGGNLHIPCPRHAAQRSRKSSWSWTLPTVHFNFSGDGRSDLVDEGKDLYRLRRNLDSGDGNWSIKHKRDHYTICIASTGILPRLSQ
ncbi:hypothetical protein PGTUg99_004377 [Puccinia graminis f. sp. tritici]|uniref:Uncharacterized protein n=1 Tax=Puccinia graminis f. sp. tritici TaxID=56615 RepID=A0A5B0QG84_PUCGR|nr:hypothetical protein PGTUg99_004377 [Puccinia graminis f. sp. tritici]